MSTRTLESEVAKLVATLRSLRYPTYDIERVHGGLLPPMDYNGATSVLLDLIRWLQIEALPVYSDFLSCYVANPKSLDPQASVFVMYNTIIDLLHYDPRVAPEAFLDSVSGSIAAGLHEVQYYRVRTVRIYAKLLFDLEARWIRISSENMQETQGFIVLLPPDLKPQMPHVAQRWFRHPGINTHPQLNALYRGAVSDTVSTASAISYRPPVQYPYETPPARPSSVSTTRAYYLHHPGENPPSMRAEAPTTERLAASTRDAVYVGPRASSSLRSHSRTRSRPQSRTRSRERSSMVAVDVARLPEDVKYRLRRQWDPNPEEDISSEYSGDYSYSYSENSEESLDRSHRHEQRRTRTSSRRDRQPRRHSRQYTRRKSRAPTLATRELEHTSKVRAKSIERGVNTDTGPNHSSLKEDASIQSSPSANPRGLVPLSPSSTQRLSDQRNLLQLGHETAQKYINPPVEVHEYPRQSMPLQQSSVYPASNSDPSSQLLQTTGVIQQPGMLVSAQLPELNVHKSVVPSSNFPVSNSIAPEMRAVPYHSEVSYPMGASVAPPTYQAHFQGIPQPQPPQYYRIGGGDGPVLTPAHPQHPPSQSEIPCETSQLYCQSAPTAGSTPNVIPSYGLLKDPLRHVDVSHTQPSSLSNVTLPQPSTTRSYPTSQRFDPHSSGGAPSAPSEPPLYHIDLQRSLGQRLDPELEARINDEIHRAEADSRTLIELEKGEVMRQRERSYTSSPGNAPPTAELTSELPQVSPSATQQFQSSQVYEKTGSRSPNDDSTERLGASSRIPPVASRIAAAMGQSHGPASLPPDYTSVVTTTLSDTPPMPQRTSGPTYADSLIGRELTSGYKQRVMNLIQESSSTPDTATAYTVANDLMQPYRHVPQPLVSQLASRTSHSGSSASTDPSSLASQVPSGAQPVHDLTADDLRRTERPFVPESTSSSTIPELVISQPIESRGTHSVSASNSIATSAYGRNTLPPTYSLPHEASRRTNYTEPLAQSRGDIILPPNDISQAVGILTREIESVQRDLSTATHNATASLYNTGAGRFDDRTTTSSTRDYLPRPTSTPTTVSTDHHAARSQPNTSVLSSVNTLSQKSVRFLDPSASVSSVHEIETDIPTVSLQESTSLPQPSVGTSSTNLFRRGFDTESRQVLNSAADSLTRSSGRLDRISELSQGNTRSEVVPSLPTPDETSSRSDYRASRGRSDGSTSQLLPMPSSTTNPDMISSTAQPSYTNQRVGLAQSTEMISSAANPPIAATTMTLSPGGPSYATGTYESPKSLSMVPPQRYPVPPAPGAAVDALGLLVANAGREGTPITNSSAPTTGSSEVLNQSTGSAKYTPLNGYQNGGEKPEQVDTTRLHELLRQGNQLMNDVDRIGDKFTSTMGPSSTTGTIAGAGSLGSTSATSAIH
ncbi:hypothetical protein GMRT_14073 [Giardia muris]|uniref:Uncharacterized protein n=1 Tax=Giardia muris TaxID=5742 RepID=A0A4Z1T9U2_GIAMU|nr:hypothetical protein GMRT_14073 [Giardia muris]|eukprot:TNJ29279.1 hypothetical protein GMRT_14073 [Giardia muris]